MNPDLANYRGGIHVDGKWLKTLPFMALIPRCNNGGWFKVGPWQPFWRTPWKPFLSVNSLVEIMTNDQALSVLVQDPQCWFLMSIIEFAKLMGFNVHKENYKHTCCWAHERVVMVLTVERIAKKLSKSPGQALLVRWAVGLML
ncbi:unnamed protein product [Camellia sinensis]